MNLTPFKTSKTNQFLKSLLTVILFVALAVAKANAQDDKVYTKVDVMAMFPGGLTKLIEYLKSNMVYPAKAKEDNVHGVVFLTFVVEKDGSLDNIQLLRGIGSGCDEEAIRVIKASPKWKPATVNDQVVRSQFTVPVSFHLPGAPIQHVPNADGVYTAVEQQASFPGGLQEFGNYLAQSIRYPDDARKNNIQGKVFLTFVVEKDGSLTNIKVLRGIGGGCDEEAVRVMEASPKWQPGMQGEQAVRSQFTVPISFSLTKK
ncbi:energy transducer TonB [Mucilaginibacter boryungensis]|uniref:Energy transducer TonB n=1 Tax=Mucilaginibacter boryungensis TaxID=768480 RepID=A0ABR9XLT5_9SPHI|nr:energy transducer TonB [Mucilaginibacter boryungensis]MBE9668186.1 energy transducer TonB [Mucilaginibacter boryungensis]